MKKGFTLAELLGVIIVLALISMIAIPAITTSLNKHKKNLCDTQISYMITAARNWGADHLLQLPDEGETLTITLSELIKQGYMQGDSKASTEEDKLKVINPNTSEYFAPDPTIIITKSGKNYLYTMDGVTTNSCKDSPTSYKVTLLGTHTHIENGRSMTNQIVNGSFEDGETGWSTSRVDEAENSLAITNTRFITTEKSVSGLHSYHFVYTTWEYQKLTANDQDKLYYGGKFMTEVKQGPFLQISKKDATTKSKLTVTVSPDKFTLNSKTFIADGEAIYFQVGLCKSCSNSNTYVDDMIAVNLTQTFGAGNEPTKEEMDAIGWFDGTIQIASKSDMNQVDFKVTAEEGYAISNRIVCNSGYATFENGVLSVKGMNQDTICRIESVR